MILDDDPNHSQLDVATAPDILSIVVTMVDDLAVVTASGELDVSNSAGLHECLQDAMDSGIKEILVDIEDLTYLDSSGLSVLWNAYQRMSELEGSMVVFGPAPNVAKVLDLTGMGAFLHVQAASGQSPDGNG
jgi:stage II sporulation protein AA (anti-sigma F factor antagonist)